MSDKFILGMFLLQWFLIIVVYSTHQTKIKDLLDLINVQGSELNKYFTLFGELSKEITLIKERVTELETVNEKAKVAPKFNELLESITLHRNRLNFNMSLVFEGKTRNEVVPIYADFFLLDNGQLFEEVKELARKCNFIPLDHKVLEFIDTICRYEREMIGIETIGRKRGQRFLMDIAYGKVPKPSDVQHIIRDAVLDCDTIKSDDSSPCDNSSSSSSSE